MSLPGVRVPAPNVSPSEADQTAANVDAFDETAASLGDFVVTLLTASPDGAAGARGRDRASRRAAGALSRIVVALADARSRLPGDDGILDDLDRAREAFTLLSESGAAEGDALAALGPALEKARRLAIERAAAAPVRIAEQASAPPPLVASRGTPSLHRDVRLEALPQPVAARAFGAFGARPGAQSGSLSAAQTALRRWARDALEELAIAGSLRRPREDEMWCSGRAFEERALASLDTLASLGRGASNDERIDVARAVDDVLHEWSIPDPGRAFAGMFALGCLHGHGAAARLHVHARNLHASTALAVEDALALGSSPHIDGVVLSLLCEDDRPDLLALGLAVARRRRRVPAGPAIELLSHPEPRVAIAAVRACASVEPRLARAPLEEALFGPEALAVHAAEALATMHAPPAGWAGRLAEISSGDARSEAAAHALLLRVLGGRGREVEALLPQCGRFSRAIAIDLLGWLGSAGALDLLRDALGDGDRSLRERAAWSLARITGAGREGLGSIDVDEEGNPVPDPDSLPAAPESAAESPAGDSASAAFDTATFDSTHRHPPLDPSFWTEPIARARSVDAPRLRFGRPLDVAAVLDELLDPGTRQGARRVLLSELGMLSAGQAPGLAAAGQALALLDADDWIARQEHVLSLAREALAAETPGLLPSPGERR